ncbi:MAG: ABC transporter ATP-binding protein [Thomasclavelia sp.]
MNKILLEAKNISKMYDLDTKNPFFAIKDISLTVNKGDFICIMGPSGSGKSTLINNISTIDIPTKGQVYIDGREINSMSEKEIGNFRFQELGFMFQNYNLLQSLTIYENIVAPLSLQKRKIKDINQRILNLARPLKIDKILDKFPSECSGGEKQRVSICRALVSDPKIIIADEPTGNLDSKNSHELLKILKKLNEEQIKTIIMVTHDPQIASYSSKLIYLYDGKIVKELEKGKLSQKEYFYQIIKLISNNEQMNLVDD